MTEGVQELQRNYRKNVPAIAVSTGIPGKPTHLYTIPWNSIEESAKVVDSILNQVLEVRGQYTTVSNRVYLPNDQVLDNVHDEWKCAGSGCAIHHPSSHHMVKMSQNYNNAKGFMTRICEHDHWHPDPDDLVYYGKKDNAPDFTHSCDNCCKPPRAPQKKKPLKLD